MTMHGGCGSITWLEVPGYTAYRHGSKRATLDSLRLGLSPNLRCPARALGWGRLPSDKGAGELYSPVRRSSRSSALAFWFACPWSAVVRHRSPLPPGAQRSVPPIRPDLPTARTCKPSAHLAQWPAPKIAGELAACIRCGMCDFTDIPATPRMGPTWAHAVIAVYTRLPPAGRRTPFSGAPRAHSQASHDLRPLGAPPGD